MNELSLFDKIVNLVKPIAVVVACIFGLVFPSIVGKILFGIIIWQIAVRGKSIFNGGAAIVKAIISSFKKKK